MSHVTSIIVTARTYSSADTSPAVDEINRWLIAAGHPPLMRVDTAWRGVKAIEVPIWIGAFASLDPDGFAATMYRVIDDSISVLVCRTGDDQYVQYIP